MSFRLIVEERFPTRLLLVPLILFSPQSIVEPTDCRNIPFFFFTNSVIKFLFSPLQCFSKPENYDKQANEEEDGDNEVRKRIRIPLKKPITIWLFQTQHDMDVPRVTTQNQTYCLPILSPNGIENARFWGCFKQCKSRAKEQGM